MTINILRMTQGHSFGALIVLMILVFVSEGEAKPKYPWYKERHHMRDTKHQAPQNGHDNQQFKDLEYFDTEDLGSNTERLSYSEFESSGDNWDSDDEDLARVERVENVISAIPRKDQPSPYSDQNEPPKFHKYEVIEEEYTGNELSDLDKIDELRRRVNNMQDELQEMQNLLHVGNYRSRG